MNAVAKQPSAFHPSSVLSSTPLKPKTSRPEESELVEYESPIKGHKIRARGHDPRSQRSSVLATVEEASTIGHESTLHNNSSSPKMKSSPLANLGEVMQKTMGDRTPSRVVPSRRIVHSPRNVPTETRPKSPAQEPAPTLTNAMVNLNLHSFLNKSPILREKFMRIQRERDTSPLKEADGQWVVQSPDKEPGPDYRSEGIKGSRYEKRQELKFSGFTERQTSPVRYRKEIDTSDLSEVSPTKRRRKDSPERRRMKKAEVKAPPTSFRPITPPNQWARVKFASPEREVRKPSPRKISPVKRLVKPAAEILLPSAPVRLAPEVVTSPHKRMTKTDDVGSKLGGDNRRPKLMNRSGQLLAMPKSPAEERNGTAQPKRSVTIPEVVKKAMQSPEEFLKSLARSARTSVSEDVASEASQRSGIASQRSGLDSHWSGLGSQRSEVESQRSGGGSQRSEVGSQRSGGGSQRSGMNSQQIQPPRNGARPKEKPVPKKSTIDSKRFAEALAGKIADQRRDHVVRNQDSGQRSDASNSDVVLGNPSTLNPSDPYGGARPKTGPSMEKWKRPTHMKPQAATTRNLNRDMASLHESEIGRKAPGLVHDFYHHLESLNGTLATSRGHDDETTLEPGSGLDSRSCLGLTRHDETLDTLDDVSSIASLRSLEADSIQRPTPSQVRIADTSSTAWTKTGANEELETSSTRILVEKIQEPKVRKTYRNASPTKKFPTPFLPIEPAVSSRRDFDQSLVVPKLITQIVVDERRSPKKKETRSPSRKVAPARTTTNCSPQKKAANADADSSYASTTTSPRKKTSQKENEKRTGSRNQGGKVKTGSLEVRGASAAFRKPNESALSPMKRDVKSIKEKKRGMDADLISSLKSSLKSEIDYLLRTRQGVNTEELVRALKLAESLQQPRRSSSQRSSRDSSAIRPLESATARSDDSREPGTTTLRRAGTYEVVNESEWGELDTVPTSEAYESEKYSPTKRDRIRSATASDSRASETLLSARSTVSEMWTSARSAHSLRVAAAESTTTRSNPALASDLEVVRAARIRALDTGSQISDTRRGGTTPRARTDTVRSETRSRDRDSSNSLKASLPASLDPKVRDLKATAKSQTLRTPSRDEQFEAQKLDLKASLKGVKAKLETLRADLRMSSPKTDAPDSVPQRASRLDKARSESDREPESQSVSMLSDTRKESSRSDSMISQKSTPSLAASQRLGEIEENLRRRQETNERHSVLASHENHLIKMAAQCQSEVRMIRMVRSGELSYERYGREMVDILAERLENLHVLKSKVLSIPR